jgi:hypothetical protein
MFDRITDEPGGDRNPLATVDSSSKGYVASHTLASLTPDGKSYAHRQPPWNGMLIAMRTFSRLIATSILLVTMAVFVLQGATSASSHSHGGQVSTVAAPAHEHGTVGGHSHDDAVADHAPFDRSAPSEDDHGFAQTESCCGTFCSAVLCVIAPTLDSARIGTHKAPALQSMVPDGIGPEGLKRPPRTIGMA